jgi:hypothetical protein
MLPGMEHTVLADGTRVARTPEGESRVWSPAPRVVVTSFSGYGSYAFAAVIKRDTMPFFEPGTRSVLFSDWYDMTGYDSRARVELTRWMSWMRPRISDLHLLVRSKIVSMGVAVANLALGGWLNSTTNRVVWKGMLQEAVRRAQERSAFA